MGFFTNHKGKSSEELMVLVQNGDHRAFSVIYDRYSGRMKAFFLRMLWQEEELAEDQVHDLFAKLIEKPELFKPEFAFEPWIFRIAINMCKNMYRKRQFEREYLAHLESEGIELSTIDEKLDQEVKRDALSRALDQLDENKRELFLLRFQQELSIIQLASHFEVSEGTIKSRLFYIKKGLTEALVHLKK